MTTPLHHNPLHIYRSILRATTYHPDPRARTWLTKHTCTSFRKSRDRLLTEYPTWSDLTRSSRETNLLKRARKFHSLLCRANDGSVDHFRKTLNLVYGRRGPRRRELMHDLMAITTPNPSELSDQGRPNPAPIAPPRFLALAASQSLQLAYIPSQSRKIQHRGPKDELPPTTIWNRPMPEIRVQRHRDKWYAKEADTLYPPLVREEWGWVRGVALGLEGCRLVDVKRRTRVGGSSEPESEGATGENGEEDSDVEGMTLGLRNLNLLAPLDRPLPKRHLKKPATERTRSRWLSRQYAWLLRHIPLEMDSLPPPDATVIAEDDSDRNTDACDQPTAPPATSTSTCPNDSTTPHLRAHSKSEAKAQEKPDQKPTKADPRQAGPQFLWDDAYMKTVYVKERVRDAEARRALFGAVGED